MKTVRTIASACLGTLALCACGGSPETMSQGDTGAPQDAKGSEGATHAPKLSFITIGGSSTAPDTINAISNSGTVVGFTTKTVGSGSINSNFLREATGKVTMLDLGDPSMGMANAVNKNDEVVGAVNGEAFILMGTKMTSLMPFGSTSSVALGINDEGVVVGQYMEDSKHTPGFIDMKGEFTKVVPTPKSTIVNVQGINNHGLAIGFYSEEGPTQHGFTLDTNTMKTTLLADPSTAHTAKEGLLLTQFLAVNDSDEAVGYYQTKNNGQYGFLYDLSSMTYTFLDDPQAMPVKGVQVTQITGIDDAGEIAGFFVDGEGTQHGFVASPSAK